MKEIDEQVIKEDLEFMSNNLVEAVNKIKEVYEKMNEIYNLTFEQVKGGKK